MLNCRDSHRLQVERMDRQLSAAERMHLRIHLMMCGRCGRFAGQMDLIHRAMDRLKRSNTSTMKRG
ncbi:MAG: zf-HC2 domain-containing protein [Paraburkholderia sp.]|nr:MAG: zf-HC2 domain-containing protein [Paraburkholderia sp.]